MLEDDEEDNSNETDPTKIFAIGVKKFDEPTSTVEEPMKEVNLGTEENSKNVIISLNLTPNKKNALIKILKEYKDTFPWSYEDMLGLDPSLV